MSSTRRRSRALYTALSVAIAAIAVLPASSIIVDSPENPHNRAATSAYVSHDIIAIDGDSGFLASNATTGISKGNGTASDPYIIRGWSIDCFGVIIPTDYGIWIANADVYFVIEDCYFYVGDWFNGIGIELSSARNGTLRNNTFDTMRGISLAYSNNCTVMDNDCHGLNAVAIELFCSDNNTVTGNNAVSGMSVYSSSDNIIEGNTCSQDSCFGIQFSYSDENHVLNNSLSGTLESVHLEHSNSNRIIGNNCSGNGNNGISLFYSNDNEIANNDCSDEAADGLMVTSGSSGCVIRNNTCSGDLYGIVVSSSDGGLVLNNTCLGDYCGVWLVFSTNDTVRNNTMAGGGLLIDGDRLDEFNTHDIDNSSTVNGEAILYYRNESGIDVPATAGQVILANCTNMTVQNQDLSGTTVGIELAFTNDSLLLDNNCSDSGSSGIILQYSNNNTVDRNTCSLCPTYGIFLKNSDMNIVINSTCSGDGTGIWLHESDNNGLVGNLVTGSSDYGISLSAGSGNSIWLNNCTDNLLFGIYLYNSESNIIWNNTFFRNNGAVDAYDAGHVQAFDGMTNNRWNTTDRWNISGSLHAYGNFWSDWIWPDNNSDGIIDAPYTISGGLPPMDYWPLASPPGMDRTTPFTTASVSGTPGNNGWYVSGIVITLNATDDGSGVKSTYYRPGDIWWYTVYQSPVLFNIEGKTNFWFWSLDGDGNYETAKKILAWIDLTAPSTEVSRTGDDITFTASDNVSGVNRTCYRVGDNPWTEMNGSFTLTISGPGNFTVEYYSTDNAGNNESVQTIYVDHGADEGGLLLAVIASAAAIVAVALASVAYARRRKRGDGESASPPNPPPPR